MQQVTKNSFVEGMVSDLEKNQTKPTSYVEAHNVELVEGGSFLALVNVKGTTDLSQIISDNVEVLGVFEATFKIDDVNRKCLLIITAGTNLTLLCYDTETNTTYSLFEQSVGGDYLTEDRIIDAVRYSENGIDVIYFTDFYHELRQLRCEIDSYTPNFLSEYDLSLQRRGANGTITLFTVTSGGSLLSGTYQFAYRMLDPETKKFTKWSSLTSPIHVYVRDSPYYLSYSGIGLPTPNRIVLTVTPTDDETDNFDFFQLAVVENIFPTPSLTASVLEVRPISDLSGSIHYKSNDRIGTIPIEDIVVDLAPIETAKTLNVKQNRLFAGNIKYRPLVLDNGTPSITSGSISNKRTTSRTFYYDQINASKYVGYFRDEVYRFGIVYIDKYGNKSAPVALDLSGVTDNQISGGLTDMKFPSRSFNNTYSLLNSNDGVRPLGLQLNGIVNHPTWAVAFEIVRVKRIKRIQFQTPVIPGATVEGIGAFSRYPAIINTSSDDGDTKEYPDAQPMTSSKVVVPKNLFWPELRSITRRNTAISGDGIFGANGFGQANKGEAQLEPTPEYDTAFIFPQPDMYGDTPYNYVGNEALETIDYCICKLNLKEYNTSEVGNQTGNHINTKVAGNFYAVKSEDYYYNFAWVGLPSIADTKQVTEYAFVNNLGEGIVLGGEKVLQHSELSTKGVPLGYQPTNQKMGVIKLRSPLNDDNTTRTFGATTRNAYSGNAIIFTVGASTSLPRYETFSATSTSGTVTNKFINEYSNYSSIRYVQMLRITNVIRGEVADNRYGEPTTQHEYISTGARYAFTPSELVDVQAGNSVPINIEVWGGDCFVGYHIFKVSDSTYSVVNQEKNTGTAGSGKTANNLLRERWNNILYSLPNSSIEPNAKIMMPVALEGVAQYVQLFLESEYNGEVRDYDVLSRSITISDTPVLNITSESAIRTPLTYNYNLNLSKQNDDKIYFSKPPYFVEQNNFSARIAISDQKIYNSDVQGFDVFRALSFYDLEESGGSLTKLGLAADNLYGIQERRISYLPVGQTQLEQTDGGTIAVGSGDVIGRPIVIDTNKGSQHLRGIVETGNLIYIPDNRNKSIYRLGGQELQSISDLFNATLWRNNFATVVPENEIIGIYDPIRKDYLISSPDYCYRFNETLNLWQGNYEFSGLAGGVTTNQNLYLLSNDESEVRVHTMYTGDRGQLFGEAVVPRVTLIVNPQSDVSKTFDDFAIVASNQLDTVDCVVERDVNQGSQQSLGMNLAVTQLGNYRIKILRDAVNARLRGLKMTVTLKWQSNNILSTLSSVLTKFRAESRRPF